MIIIVVLVTLMFAVLIFLISITWPYLKGAPWFPTGQEKVIRMLSMLELKQGDTVYDLGCGDGRFLFTSVKKYKTKAIGVEIDPIRAIWLKLKTKYRGEKNVKVIWGDLFKKDISDADAVICYLWPKTNRNLEKKLLNELKAGTKVISNSFIFPNLKVIKEDKKNQIYLYKI